MDFEVQRCTRHCSKTERELQPEEEFYSVLVAEGAEVVRYDYCSSAWEGPPEDALGWWKSKMPSRNAHKLHWAPNDIMLEYFEELESQPEKQDVRYILALLMIRRRVLRVEDTDDDQQGGERLNVYCPRREKNYEVAVDEPDTNRTREIQEELAQLLFADAG
jgi:hypothetical protein